MKVSSSKSKKSEGPTVKSNAETKKRYEVEQISNGYLVSETWMDEKYNHHCVKTYHETNPLDKKAK